MSKPGTLVRFKGYFNQDIYDVDHNFGLNVCPGDMALVEGGEVPKPEQFAVVLLLIKNGARIPWGGHWRTYWEVVKEPDDA